MCPSLSLTPFCILAPSTESYLRNAYMVCWLTESPCAATVSSNREQNGERNAAIPSLLINSTLEPRASLPSWVRTTRDLRTEVSLCARPTRTHGFSRTRPPCRAGKAQSRDVQQPSAPWTVARWRARSHARRATGSVFFFFIFARFTKTFFASSPPGVGQKCHSVVFYSVILLLSQCWSSGLQYVVLLFFN